MASLPSEKELFKQIMLTNDMVWKYRIDKNDVENWLSNFEGEVYESKYERQLALWLLTNFVFYNEDEVRHLCRTLYRDFIHHMLSENDEFQEKNIADVVKSILESSSFYQLGRPGESSGFILYLFRQENNLPTSSFIDPRKKSIPKKIKNVIYVDDVTISGSQADKYLERETEDYDSDKNKILLTFMSTDEAIRLLREHDINTISCIMLDERNKCFSSNSNTFNFLKEYLVDCKKFAEHYGKKLWPTHPLGYRGGQYAFGFFYNTPDNTLPIFWAEWAGWTPIMKRYRKQKWMNYNEIGRFV